MSRGRDATTPTEIPPPGWKDILFRVKDEIAADNLSLIAAGIAFYGLLAIFPGIAALMAVAGLMLDPATVTEQISGFTSALPEEAAAILVEQAKSVAGAPDTGVTVAAVFGVVLALYSASKGVDNLALGIGIAYDEPDERGFIKRKAVMMALTLAMVFGALLIVGLLVAVPAVLAFVNLGSGVETAATWLRWPVVLLIATGGLAVLYRFGPDRADAKWRWTTPGAALAVALWILGTAAFAIYVRNFGSYNETFGTIAGVIILLMWLWLSAFMILIGAEFDAEMEAQTKRDSTTGETRPMGERGAVKADNLGEAVSR